MFKNEWEFPYAFMECQLIKSSENFALFQFHLIKAQISVHILSDYINLIRNFITYKHLSYNVA